jgi:hypothetical protein
MPITIKHQPIAGAAAGAFAAGVGSAYNRRRKEEQDLLEQQQRWQSMAGMDARREQARLVRDALDNQFRAGENQRDREAKAIEGQLDRDVKAGEQRWEWVQREVNSGRAAYSPDQVSRYQNLSTELSWIQEQPGISEEDKEYARQWIMPQLDDIRMNPQVTLQQPQPLEDRLRSSVTNYDQVSHLPWQFDPKTGAPTVDKTAYEAMRSQQEDARKDEEWKRKDAENREKKLEDLHKSKMALFDAKVKYRGQLMGLKDQMNRPRYGDSAALDAEVDRQFRTYEADLLQRENELLRPGGSQPQMGQPQPQSGQDLLLDPYGWQRRQQTGQPQSGQGAPMSQTATQQPLVGDELANRIVQFAATPEGGDRVMQQVAEYVQWMTPEDRASLTPEAVQRLAGNAQDQFHSRAVSAAMNRLSRAADPGERDADVSNVIDRDMSAGVIMQLPFLSREAFESATEKQMREWGLVEGSAVLTEDGMIYEVRY